VRNSHKNPLAKSNANSDVFMTISKIINVLLFSFIRTQDQQWVNVIGMVVLSIWMFLNYNSYMPYYNTTMLKVYLIMTGVYCWNTLVLLLAKVYYLLVIILTY